MCSQELLGSQRAVEFVESIGSLKNKQDTFLWLHEKSGCFSTKSAWEIIRFKMPKFEWARWVWHKFLPKKISLCMWKAVFGYLSVDAQVRCLGIALNSSCNCYLSRHVETLEHVLGKRDFAMEVWKLASAELGIPFIPQQCWQERVQIWFNRATRQSQVGTLLGLLPSMVV